MTAAVLEKGVADFLGDRLTADKLAGLYDPRFVKYRHSVMMGLQLRRLVNGIEPWQIWTYPPQIGKSEMAVRKGPVWMHDWYPDLHIISAAYGAQLAQKSTRYCRNIGREFGGNVLRWQLDPTRSAQHEYYTTEGGSMRAVGVGGPIIGNPADVILLDDLLKNWEEAQRVGQRDRVWNWILSDVQSRLQDGARGLMVGTRWHPDDPIGRMTEYDDWDWTYTHVPAVADSTITPEGDPLGREDGEVIEPRRFRRSTMLQRKRRAGPFIWNALYQGVPSLIEGGILRRSWFETLPAMPRRYEALQFVTSWDCTFSDTADGSYVVGQAWCLTPDRPHRFLLYDQIRGRWDFPGTRSEFQRFLKRHPECTTHLIENTANGPALASEMSLLGTEGIVTVPPGKMSKLDRAIRISPLVADGRVALPGWLDGRDWIDDLLQEVTEFPNSKNDDRMDAMSQALTWLDRHAADMFGRENTVDDERLFGRR